MVLSNQGVPNVPHDVYLNPANPFTANYVSKDGIWTGIQDLVGKHGFPVVLKPLKGTGGLDVMKATCWREVEAAVQHIFGREYGLAVSPYKKVVDEFRCICLDRVVELTYRKVRSSVLGDGHKSVGVLLAEKLMAASPEDMAALTGAASELRSEELARVPSAGETVALQWKHNLGQGATADLEIPSEMKTLLSQVAVKAVAAIGMRFCSVDIIDVEGEGLMVIEVNSGVMMDSLMVQLGEKGKALAERLYESAILRALAIERPLEAYPATGACAA